ncbi:MAG: hypothetical protein KDE55_11370 [Novosphingobium sp.]|nr:hypothetical protein [Novosphingobium sp.]
MALTNKLVVYDTTLEQVLVFIVGRDSPSAAKAAALKDVVLKYEVQLSDQAYRVLQSNPLLKQKIQLDMIQIGKTIVQQKIMRQMAPNQQATPLFVRRVEAALNEGREQVNALVDSVLKRHAEMDKAWGDYYRSQRRDLILNAVGIAITVTALALSVPSGGASIALAIAGGAKSIAGSVNKLKECWRTAEEQRDRINKAIKMLLAAYLKSVHAGRSVQVTGMILDNVGVLPVIEMLPFVNRQLMPSMQKINTDMDVYKGKLGHLYSAANKLAAQLFDVLDKLDEWEAQNPGVDHPKAKKLRKQIEDLLDNGKRQAGFRSKLTISGAYVRYETGMADYTLFKQEMQKINGIEKHPRALILVQNIIKILANIGFAAGGYAADGAPGAALEIAATATTAIGDTIGIVTDCKDFYDEIKGQSDSTQFQQVVAQVEAQYEAIPVPPPPPVPPRSSGRLVSRPPNRPAPLPPAPRGPAPKRPLPPLPPRPNG